MEADPTTTPEAEQTGIPPEIDHTKLIEQDGPNVGVIAAVETAPGLEYTETGSSSPGGSTEVAAVPTDVIAGMPVIAAFAGEKAHNDIKNYLEVGGDTDAKMKIDDKWIPIWNAIGPDALTKEIAEQYYDEEETNAMAAEVRRRAEHLDIVERASEDLKKQIVDQAESNFRKELANKQAERKKLLEAEAQKKAEIQAGYDEEARKLLVTLQEGAPTLGVLKDAPEPESKAVKAFDHHSESPSSEDSSETIPYTPKDLEFEPARAHLDDLETPGTDLPGVTPATPSTHDGSSFH